jgi:hypothetical protein
MTLTPEQSELVKLLSQGFRLKQIARRQGKPYNTVKGLAWWMKRSKGMTLAVIIYRYEQVMKLRNLP